MVLWGGVSLDPQLIYQTKTLAANGGSYSFANAQSGKDYIGTMSLNVNGSQINAQQGVWHFKDGVITEIFSGVSNFSCAMNGNNVKFTNNTGGQASLVIIQLD